MIDVHNKALAGALNDMDLDAIAAMRPRDACVILIAGQDGLKYMTAKNSDPGMELRMAAMLIDSVLSIEAAGPGREFLPSWHRAGAKLALQLLPPTDRPLDMTPRSTGPGAREFVVCSREKSGGKIEREFYHPGSLENVSAQVDWLNRMPGATRIWWFEPVGLYDGDQT